MKHFFPPLPLYLSKFTTRSFCSNFVIENNFKKKNVSSPVLLSRERGNKIIYLVNCEQKTCKTLFNEVEERILCSMDIVHGFIHA